jgi:SAM-dependent methyltransferase
MGRPGDGKRAQGDDTGWDNYWRGNSGAPAPHPLGERLEASLQGFWSALFEGASRGPGASRLLDAGCGNGAVTRFALEAAKRAGRPVPLVHGVDRSLPALRDLRDRFPSAFPVVADSARIPFRDGCFDLVASQFGLEYGGAGAFSEAARLVAPGGALAAAIHVKDGGLHRECAVNLEAVDVVRGSGMLRAARDVFRESRALTLGTGRPAAFRQVDVVLGRWGEGVAGGEIHRLYADIAHMYGRKGAYEPDEVSRWLEATEGELAAYAGRMSAMIAAAVDAAGMDAIVARVGSRGLVVRTCEALRIGAAAGEPAAWLLVCERPPAA